MNEYVKHYKVISLYSWGAQIRKAQNGGMWSMRDRKQEMHNKFLLFNIEGEDHLGNRCVLLDRIKWFEKK